MIPKEIMKLYEKLAFSRGYEEAFRDFLDVFTICLSGCWQRITVEWKKDISHLKWKFLFKCFIGCLNIRKDFAMSWEICSWSVSVMGITDSSYPDTRC